MRIVDMQLLVPLQWQVTWLHYAMLAVYDSFDIDADVLQDRFFRLRTISSALHCSKVLVHLCCASAISGAEAAHGSCIKV